MGTLVTNYVDKGKLNRETDPCQDKPTWPEPRDGGPAAGELGTSHRELASRLEMKPPGVRLSVERGEAIARDNGLTLTD